MDLKLLVSLAILLIKAKGDDDSANHASKFAAIIIGNRTTGGPNMQFVQSVMEGMQELQLRRSKFSRQGKSDGEMNKVHSTLRKTVGPKSNQTTPNGESHPSLQNFALEGDMIVNPSQIDQIITGKASNGTRSKRGATTDPSSYWTVGVPIPYEIDSSLNNLRSKIEAGLQFWMDHSCITFVEDPNANNRLRYYYGQGCWSYVGKQTKWPSQDISIGDGCSSLGTICHETMHAMGFYHTQSNYDRDSYIYVDYSNINPSLRYNFDKMTSATQTLLGVEYDYGSVMQYPPYAFAINNNLPTSMSIDPNYQNFMGQRVAPAFSDIKALNNLYKCANQCYTKATCYNNGIVNPNYCTTCICPKYFGGDQCQTLARGNAPVCNGQVIQATSSSMQYFTFTAGQGMTYAFAAKTGDCYWMIQAPVGRRIQIQMKSIDTTCMESCPWAGFEINLGKLDLYGIFTCCQSFSNSLYTSISNAVYLGAFVNFNNANMVLELCSRHCFRSQVGHLKNIPSGNRTAREAGYGEDSLVTGGGSSSGGCSACCMPGAAGPAGSPGQNGKPGRPGAPGNPGNPGRPPQQACDPITPPPCQPCNPGSPGQPGPQGQPGDAGRDGIPGRPGGDGQPGNAGPKGPPGPNGNPGSPGGPGNPGNDAPNEPASPGAPGPAGEPGPDGPPGQPGQPGSTGQPGQSGPKGPNGQDGQPGADGNPGPMGDPGNSGSGGERGICPKYCAIDGGVFFEDGTRR